MKKNITVIVKQQNSTLGQEGQILKVTPGYAFNYLIPHNIVEIGTKGKLKHIQMFNNIKNQQRKKVELEMIKIKSFFNELQIIQMKKKVGEKQLIFGSVNDKDVITTILNKTGYILDKKQITVPEIKSIGLFNINIHFLNNESCTIQLQVVPKNI